MLRIYFVFCFQAAVDINHQPVYWMLLVTPTIPVIEVMEAILATEVWVVPVIHGHSFCLWPVWIIPPERKNRLISAQIMPFDIVPPSKPTEGQFSSKGCWKTWAIKHNATNNCWERVYGFFQSRQTRQNLGSAISHWHHQDLVALPAIYVIGSPHGRSPLLLVAQLLVLAPQLLPLTLDPVLLPPPLVLDVHSFPFQPLPLHPFPFQALPFNFQSLPSDLQPLPLLPLADGLEVLLPLPALAGAIWTETEVTRVMPQQRKEGKRVLKIKTTVAANLHHPHEITCVWREDTKSTQKFRHWSNDSHKTHPWGQILLCGQENKIPIKYFYMVRRMWIQMPIKYF